MQLRVSQCFCPVLCSSFICMVLHAFNGTPFVPKKKSNLGGDVIPRSIINLDGGLSRFIIVLGGIGWRE